MESKKRNKYLAKNTLIFAIGNFGMKFISFFLVPLYTYVLTTREYGTADLVYTIGMVLAPMITCNIGEAVMRFSLDKNCDHEKIMSTGLIFLVSATILGLIVFPLSGIIPEVSSYGKSIYFYTITLGYSQTFLSYLRGKEQLLEYSIGNIIHSLSIALLNILFLVILHQGIEGYFNAYIFSNCITALYAFLCGNVIRVIKKFNFDKVLCRNMIKYSIVLIPNSFMWWIMDSSDRLMVTAMIGASANGIYAISYKIPALLSTLTSVFNQAWSYSAIRENESEDKEEYSNTVYDNLVKVVVMVAAGLLMIIKIFLRYYVEDSYYTAWKYTPYLIIGFVFNTLATFVLSSYTVHKDSRGMLKSAMSGAVTNVLLNWLLIPVMGVAGAALATCVSYIIVYIYRVCDTRKYIKLNILKPKHLISYLILIMMACSMFLDNWLGQMVLCLEFVFMAFYHRELILTMWKGIFGKLFAKK